MPPKKQFTREQIIEAAFTIAEKEGIKEVSLRKVARELQCSVAPIYVNFKNSSELLEAVMEKIADIAENMMMKHYTDNYFINNGIGLMKFAWKYNNLYRDLLLNNNTLMDLSSRKEKTAIIQMRRDKWFDGFTDDELQEVLLKMRVVVYGITTMYVYKLLTKELNEEEVIKIISDTGKDIIYSSKARKLNKRNR